MKHQTTSHWGVPICLYCGKLITQKDYMIHLRYPTVATLHDLSFINFGKIIHTKVVTDEYYHKRCFEKLQKQLNTKWARLWK